MIFLNSVTNKVLNSAYNSAIFASFLSISKILGLLKLFFFRNLTARGGFNDSISRDDYFVKSIVFVFWCPRFDLMIKGGQELAGWFKIGAVFVYLCFFKTFGFGFYSIGASFFLSRTFRSPITDKSGVIFIHDISGVSEDSPI